MPKIEIMGEQQRIGVVLASNNNKSLRAANKAKKDEFYTQREDIENELRHYSKHFEDKVVYCNCDDPTWSEFWQFFVRNFKAWKIKKLIATHYETEEKNYAYKLELTEDTNGDGRIDWEDEPTKTALPCNGDFRSAACIELLKEADIVVTNPPFSLFREYVAQLVEYDKKFVIIGNVNAITYKEIFPLLKENKMWLGPSIHSGDRPFWVPDSYPLKAAGCGIDEETGRKYVRTKGVRWYTNLDVTQRHESLDLRGNHYSPEKYPTYDNYDAINVNKVADIPCDYDGVMGVPITFLDKYNPDQFEIIGLSIGSLFDGNALGADFMKKYREQGGTGHYSENMIGLGLIDTDGKAKVPYGRILIRKKK